MSLAAGQSSTIMDTIHGQPPLHSIQSMPIFFFLPYTFSCFNNLVSFLNNLELPNSHTLTPNLI